MKKNLRKELSQYIRKHDKELTIVLTIVGILVSCAVTILVAYFEIISNDSGVAFVQETSRQLQLHLNNFLLVVKRFWYIIAAFLLAVVVIALFRTRNRSEPIGRENQIRAFNKLLSHKKNQILGVHGGGGVGKSLLLNFMLSICYERKISFAKIDFQDRLITPFQFLDEIIVDLDAQKFSKYRELREDYQREIERAKNKDYLLDSGERLKRLETKIIDTFFEDLDTFAAKKILRITIKKPVVILLDTVESITETELDLWLLDVFYEKIKDRKLYNVKIIVGGRKTILLEHETTDLFTLVFLSIGLVKQCLIRYSVDSDYAETVFKITRGYPLAVGILINTLQISSNTEKLMNELQNETIGQTESGKIIAVLLYKLMQTLRVENKLPLVDAMRIAAIPRWFDAAIMLALWQKDASLVYNFLDDLNKFAFVKIRSRKSGGYKYHEIAREKFLDEWLINDRTGYRQKKIELIRFFTEMQQQLIEKSREWEDAVIERLHHSLRIDIESGMNLFLDLSNFANRHYLLEFYNSLLTEIHSIELSSRNRVWADYNTANLLVLRREWVNAEKKYLELLGQVNLGQIQRGQISAALGDLYQFQGKWDLARQYYEGSLSSSTQQTDWLEEAKILGKLGDIHSYLGNWDDGIDNCNKGLEIISTLEQDDNVRLTKCRILRDKASLYRARGDWNQMIGNLEDSLSIAESLDEVNEIGQILIRIAFAYRLKGDFTTAIKYAEKALHQFENRIAYDEDGIARTMHDLAWNYRMVGKWVEAQSCIERGKYLFEKLDNPNNLARIINNQGQLYKEMGEYEKAIECHLQSINLYKELSDEFGRARTLKYLAAVYHATGNVEQAEKLMQEGLAIFRGIGHLYYVCEQLGYLGRLNAQLGNTTDAKAYYIESIELAKKAKHDFAEIQAMIYLGELLYRVEGLDSSTATNYVENAVDQAEKRKYYKLLAYGQLLLARSQLDIGNKSRSFALFADACKNSLEFNEKEFSDTFDEILATLGNLVSKKKNDVAQDLCKFLLGYSQEPTWIANMKKIEIYLQELGGEK